jgi:enterochelin esterase-like enzyme
MKTGKRFILTICIFIFTSCTPRPPVQPAETDPICTKPGTIGGDKVSHPTQGFNIYFQYYLPPCYAALKNSHFPVIYLLTVPFEARLDEQDNTPMSLADRLIRSGKMPPAILIVPDDTVGFGYQTAIVRDLVPYVDGKFRTVPEWLYRGVGGISHGGAIAARMAIQFPDVFGSLGVLSGGIATGEVGTFENWIAAASPGNRPRIRIDLGDQDSGIMPLTLNLVGVLDRYKVPYTFTVGRGNHDWNFWSPLMERYLLWFADAWK